MPSRSTWDWTNAERLDWRAPELDALVGKCAALWPEEAEWRARAESLGLNWQEVPGQGLSVLLRWRALVSHAFERRALRPLVDRVRSEAGPDAAVDKLLEQGVPVVVNWIPLPPRPIRIGLLTLGGVLAATLAWLSWDAWLAPRPKAEDTALTIRGRLSLVTIKDGEPRYTAVAKTPVVHATCDASATTDESGAFSMAIPTSHCSKPPFKLRVLGRFGREFGVEGDGFLKLDIPDGDSPARATPVGPSDVAASPTPRPATAPHAYLVGDDRVMATHDGIAPPQSLQTVANSALPAVALLRDANGAPAGTGFVAGPGLLLVPKFSSSSPQVSCADFRGDGRTCVPVGAEVYAHPSFPLAIRRLDLAAGAISPKPLTLAADAPETGAELAVVGFPMVASSNKSPTLVASVYGGRFGVKRVLDGTYLGWGDVPLFKEIRTLCHSAVTAGGSAGSPILSLDTGLVVGVHFAAKDLVGYGVPTSLLYAEASLRKYPIRFASTDGEVSVVVTTTAEGGGVRSPTGKSGN